jgi:hypothetical protein
MCLVLLPLLCKLSNLYLFIFNDMLSASNDVLRQAEARILSEALVRLIGQQSENFLLSEVRISL